MTNRPDMIDPAVTRPGRLEVKIEIGLPDEHGRVQILQIHTEKFRKVGIMQSDISIPDLARRTKNFTGAEIAGFCRSAASFALNREVDPLNPQKRVDIQKIRLTTSDFDMALKEVGMCMYVYICMIICMCECVFNSIILFELCVSHIMT